MEHRTVRLLCRLEYMLLRLLVPSLPVWRDPGALRGWWMLLPVLYLLPIDVLLLHVMLRRELAEKDSREVQFARGAMLRLLRTLLVHPMCSLSGSEGDQA